MKIENLFIKRMKELPADAITTGHKLALKGGYIHQTGAGLYTYSPIGFKLRMNIEQIVREELNAINYLEMMMPVVSPISLWRETERENIDVLLKFKTRAGVEAVMNPTHEEVIVDYVRSILQSYKQLPLSPNSLCLYHIQTKYRDELRVRAGLLRCREFTMKDAYSFHTSYEDLEAFYNITLDTYHKIYKRIGLKNVIAILAPGGDMSEKLSHEFQMISDIGEDTIYTCSDCDYKSNKEVLTDKEAEDILVCPECGGKLNSIRGVEVGNIFQLGDKYTKAMKVNYTDENGETKTPVMCCYGIGISRVMGCVLEQGESEAKAMFNMAIAPYKVHIISIGEDEKIIALADKLYNDLTSHNIEVIIDNTDDRAGSKFANADLIGAPIRAIISSKNLEKGCFEMKYSGLANEYPLEISIDTIFKEVSSIINTENKINK